MIPDVDGLVAADMSVLMFLGEHRWRIACPPATISLNTPMSDSHASRRCKKMRKAGLVELADDRGYYRITQLGLRYLNGAVEAEEIERNLKEQTADD